MNLGKLISEKYVRTCIRIFRSGTFPQSYKMQLNLIKYLLNAFIDKRVTNTRAASVYS